MTCAITGRRALHRRLVLAVRLSLPDLLLPVLWNRVPLPPVRVPTALDLLLLPVPGLSRDLAVVLPLP